MAALKGTPTQTLSSSIGPNYQADMLVTLIELLKGERVGRNFSQHYNCGLL